MQDLTFSFFSTRAGKFGKFAVDETRNEVGLVARGTQGRNALAAQSLQLIVFQFVVIGDHLCFENCCLFSEEVC